MSKINNRDDCKILILLTLSRQNAEQYKIWECGHTGFPSIYPDKNDNIQCTACANYQRSLFSNNLKNL